MPDRDERGRYLPAHSLAGPGRDTKYDETWMPEQAHNLALLGMNDEDIAKAFGIHIDTLYEWKNRYPAFSEAILSGGERADGKVARALYHRALGVTVVSEKAFKDKNGEIVVAQTKTQMPGDVRAAEIWLRNRQRKRWRKEELPTGDEIPDETEAAKSARELQNEKLAERIAVLERRRKHGQE